MTSLTPKTPLTPLTPSRPAPKPAPKEGRAKGQKGADAPSMSLEKRAKRNAKARGKYSEKRVAQSLGGRLTISSGRTALEKGDVHVDPLNLFVEVKYCGVRQGRGESSVSFDREWLEKTILDAEAVGMLPLIALRFRDGSGAYATTSEVFERLIEQIYHYKKGSDLFDNLLAAFPDEMSVLIERWKAIQKRLNQQKDY